MHSILLVEDDPALRALVVSALARNFEVIEAENRPEALAALHARPEILAALIDLGLPPEPHSPREGLAILQALRTEGLPVKAVVLTGQDDEAAALAAIQEGAFDFLGKPAPLAAIAAAIERAIFFAAKERELARRGVARLAISAPLGEGLRNVRDEAEERLVRQVLQNTAFNVHEAARRLGVKRENVYYLLKKFGITRDA
ncbi:MAG TPA: response regulator [Rhodocyclaceae bacterium]|nr:response regulator [Rhodocyclaceae bacterium]